MNASETPRRGCLVGVDYGTKRIGLAVSDHGQSIAQPATTLPGAGNASGDAGQILRWAVDQDAIGLVVGLPLNMDGSDSAQTTVTKAFAKQLAARGDLPVDLFDERLSTFQADELMHQANVPPAKRRGLRDAFAAQVILQTFLDYRSGDSTAE